MHRPQRLRIWRTGPDATAAWPAGEEKPEAGRVVVFLNDVDEGGEYAFPRAAGGKSCGEDPVACCASSVLRVLPRRGDAMLLFARTLDGRKDKSAVSIPCPVVRGERWVAEWTFFYAVKPTDRGLASQLAGAPKQARQFSSNEL